MFCKNVISCQENKFFMAAIYVEYIVHEENNRKGRMNLNFSKCILMKNENDKCHKLFLDRLIFTSCVRKEHEIILTGTLLLFLENPQYWILVGVEENRYFPNLPPRHLFLAPVL
jgi:hypothetical protein